jgi:hypothetical protein
MLSKALPFLGQLLRWDLTHRSEERRLYWGAREKCPSAWALQRALGEALLARGPQQAAPGIPAVAFERVVRPRPARDVIAVKQAGPIALADLVEVPAKLI